MFDYQNILEQSLILLTLYLDINTADTVKVFKSCIRFNTHTSTFDNLTRKVKQSNELLIRKCSSPHCSVGIKKSSFIIVFSMIYFDLISESAVDGQKTPIA